MNKNFENLISFASNYHSINVPLFDIMSGNMRSISSIEKFNKFKKYQASLRFKRLGIHQVQHKFTISLAVILCITVKHMDMVEHRFTNKIIEYEIESKDFSDAITTSLERISKIYITL